MTIRVGNTIIATVNKNTDGGNGGGLEVGDIGFAPLGIDETQNKRRYLNGQVISQSQFESFTSWVKERANLYPNTVATEENWQAEVTNSKLGQCGKFVIDDELGTIRLPKVVNINGLQDLALMGSIKTESLPNIKVKTTGSGDGNSLWHRNYDTSATGFARGDGTAYSDTNGSSPQIISITSTSDNSETYQDNAPVQQEAVQYPYFIQVATGVEESVDVTREMDLNNPFFFGMSQYFESEPNNASWLISNGSFYSGAIYVSFYEWLLKIYNSTEIVEGVSVKASTDTYDDYDYVINTADTTFRFPLLNGSENLLSERRLEMSIPNDVDTPFTAPANGFVSASGTTSTAGATFKIANNTKGLSSKVDIYTGSRGTGVFMVCEKGDSLNIHLQYTSLSYCRFIYATGNGSLYFYVGETIQDANIINASQVLTTVTDCVKKSSATDREAIVGWGIPDYTAGVAITYPDSSHKFTAPCDGIIVLFNYWSGASNFSSDTILYINGVETSFRGQSGASYYENGNGTIVAYLSKGDEIYLSRGARSARANTFYPLKGVN